MIEWILIIWLYAIGIPVEIKEMKKDFSFFYSPNSFDTINLERCYNIETFFSTRYFII
jgi:hypothetical protein